MKILDCVHWLWDTSAGFRWRMALSSVLGGAHVCISLLFIWLSKVLVDIAIGHREGTLTLFVALLPACMLALLLLSAAGGRIEALNAIRFKNKLRHRLFTHLMESCWAGKERFHTGDVLNRVEEDVRVVTDTLCGTVPSMIVTGVQFVASSCFLLMLDARLGWILLAIMPVALLASKGYAGRMRRLTREIRGTDSRVQIHVQEHLQHRAFIQALEYTSRSFSVFGALQRALQRQVMRRTDFSLLSRSLVQAGFAAGYAIAFLWGIYGLRNESVTFGLMTAFLQLVAQVQRPIVELGHRVPALVHAVTSVERVAELLALPAERQGAPLRLTGAVGLRLEQVAFAYPGSERSVVTHFTHDFRPGTSTALVGETGAGKSTLVRLMLALLTPVEGSITMYDACRTVAVSPLTRCNVVYVPQGNSLMSGTIRDNLLMGNPHATDEQLRGALHTAAAGFVFELPDGLDTLCGEQGSGLSEGQAQRIAIARGLLRPGHLLLLDEATSSLDNDTEQLLLQRLSAQTRDKTLIIVTHREAATRFCTHTVRIRNNMYHQTIENEII